MSKKLAFIHGSPRKKGNTRLAAEQAIVEVEARGVDVVHINAAELEFKAPGCISCHKCKSTDTYECHVKDGLAEAVARIAECDGVVIATPIYWFSFTAQVKMVIDRMYALVKFTENGVQGPLNNMVFGLIATGGGGIENNLEILETQWKIPATSAGAPFVSCLLPHINGLPGAIKGNEHALAQAREFGGKLAGMVLEK